MKRFAVIFLTTIVLLQNVYGFEFSYQSQPIDSAILQTFVWQQGNRSRPIVILDGEWNYQLSKKNDLKKIMLPAKIDYQGEVIFQRFFDVDSSFSDKLFRLVCYGINYYCEIFINNKFVGSHAGGYSSFFFDLPKDFVYFDQQNFLEIKVDSKLDSKNTIPSLFSPNGVKNTFGIFRSIYLIALPELGCENLNIDSKLNTDFSRCDIDVTFELKDRINHFLIAGGDRLPTQNLNYVIEIFEKDKNIRLSSQTEKINYPKYQLSTQISHQLRLKKPRLWSPENPALYLLKIKLFDEGKIIDQVSQVFGIKQLDFFNGNIFLNGNSIFIKGVNWAEDYGNHGALLNRSQLFHDLLLIKQLNANAIRVLNFPAHPYLASACDSLGLFLLQELPLNSVPQHRFESDIYLSRIKDYLSEMIYRDRLHVSVFALGLGGEFLRNDQATVLFFEKIYQEIISKQPFSFYHYFSSPIKKGILIPETIPAISIFDMGKKQIQQSLSNFVKSNPNRVNLVIAFGAPEMGYSDKIEDDVIFQKYQVIRIAQSWEEIIHFPEIDGCFISVLSDYYGNYSSMRYGNFPDAELRPIGLLNYQREQRYSFKAVQSLFREGKCRYIPGIEMKATSPNIFVIVGLILLLFFLFVFNNRRYLRENLKRIFIHPHGFFTDLRDGRKIPVMHTLFVALFILIGCGQVLASLFFYFRSQAQLDHLMTLLIPSLSLKSIFSSLVWKPELLIILFSVIILIYFLLFAFIFRIVALISRKKINLRQLLTLSFWLGGNYLILVPVSMILYRLLQQKHLFLFILIFLIFIDLWYLLRIIKGLRVIFTWQFGKAVIIIAAIFIIITAVVLYYYQLHYGFSDYIFYYFTIFKDQIKSILF